MLSLDKPLDIVKHYFAYGGHTVYPVKTKDTKKVTMGVSSEEILLGELKYDGLWLINKTFISRDITRTHEGDAESKLIAAMQMRIAAALCLDCFDEETLSIKQNVLNSISNTRRD